MGVSGGVALDLIQKWVPCFTLAGGYVGVEYGGFFLDIFIETENKGTKPPSDLMKNIKIYYFK